jgi:hypothetical protein
MSTARMLLLSAGRSYRVAPERVRDLGTLAREIGAPATHPLSRFRAIEFWFPVADPARSYNALANGVLGRLIADAAKGDYVVPDDELAQAQKLSADPDTIPLLLGPCLVTGRASAERIYPPPAAFGRWWQLNHESIRSALTAPRRFEEVE